MAFNIGLVDSPPNESAMHIINTIRLPRILGAIVVSASLALCGVIYQGVFTNPLVSPSGVIYQGVFTNPLVSPSILGVLSGASFGAALGMVLRLPYAMIEILCFAFAFLSVGFAVLLTFIFSRNDKILMLILGGIISSSLFGGLVVF